MGLLFKDVEQETQDPEFIAIIMFAYEKCRVYTMNYLLIGAMTGILIYSIFPQPSNSKSYQESIDIACKYDFIRTNEFNQFVENEVKEHWWQANFYKKNKWWEFWHKRVIYFSIDLKTKGVTGGIDGDGIYGPNNTRADIFPDKIQIQQKFEYADAPGTHLMHEFWIDRRDGSLFGSYYTTDIKTNKDEQVYSMSGVCKPIKRLF